MKFFTFKKHVLYFYKTRMTLIFKETLIGSILISLCIILKFTWSYQYWAFTIRVNFEVFTYKPTKVIA